MNFFEKMNKHEQVVFCNDPATGLKAIIAIHDTTLGPATGGTRMFPYKNINEAMEDVLRLSKGMTYKCAAADIDFGGGKAVIIGDPNKDKSPELFRAFGQYIESLNGRFYTGTDMGTMPEDFVHAAKESNFILGLPEEYGGSGDSSVTTSHGVLYGIKATAKMIWGTENLSGKTFAIQGLGKVGFKVAELLIKEGANLIVADVNEKVILNLNEKYHSQKHLIKAVSGKDIYSVAADVFVPCALGGIINHQTIGQLRVRAVVGSANNQLKNPGDGDLLRERGILYAPDYIVNAGGLIQVTEELNGNSKERVLLKTRAIYYSLLEIYEYAENENIATSQAADIICEKKLEQRKARNSFYLHKT